MEDFSLESTECWQIRKCPDHQKNKCSAFSYSLNCWEKGDLPCCRRNNKDRCELCIMYSACIKNADQLPVGCEILCDSEIQIKCSAFLQNKNCWEVSEETPCCDREKNHCETCSKYFQILKQPACSE